eukprot:CAMPEP_0178411092 /NCGR_PEP_ID=MMETSP0689_2-20121128/21318_1 /TAXON_ID=160604 /ORGANISM="Amphidinium massartii, Strain CS-259" /LENGTH=445 /DNA_ID=CAMNT_0020032291 /DNA_START=296 /DNA_END=1630 /DNA_ORIENTATION=+
MHPRNIDAAESAKSNTRPPATHVGANPPFLKEAPVFDNFSFIYWGVAITVWTLLCSAVAWHDSNVDEDQRLLATEFVIPTAKSPGSESLSARRGRKPAAPMLHSPAGMDAGKSRRASHRIGTGGSSGLFGARTQTIDDEVSGVGAASEPLSRTGTAMGAGPIVGRSGIPPLDMPAMVRQGSTGEPALRHVEMPRNLWAFLVVVALGQAKIHRIDFPRIPAIVITIVASFIQLSAVSLLLYDIDPSASPWTTNPDAQWKTSGMSVNLMKAVQIVFLIAALVPEVGQSLSVFQAVFLVRNRASELRIPSKFLVAMGCLQYCITMWTLFGGVSVVLSFQNTPDIIYSSMAITFISAADDTFYLFFEQITDIEADFIVVESLDEDPEGLDGSSASPVYHHQDLPYSVIVAMKTLSVFPLVWAVFLLSRAWYSNVMPSERVRTILQYARE